MKWPKMKEESIKRYIRRKALLASKKLSQRRLEVIWGLQRTSACKESSMHKGIRKVFVQNKNILAAKAEKDRTLARHSNHWLHDTWRTLLNHGELFVLFIRKTRDQLKSPHNLKSTFNMTTLYRWASRILGKF